MLQNYIKVALRNLWRNRLFTTLHIVGLAIGISACWLIYQLVQYEFSFNAQIPDNDRVYRVASMFVFDGVEGGNAGAPKPLADAIKQRVSGVEMVVPVHDRWTRAVYTPNASKAERFKNVEEVLQTTPNYFKLLPYQWLAGSAKALEKPKQVVLTQSRAERYFPKLSPNEMVGKTLLYDDTVAVQVAGLVADLPFATDFTGKEFLSLIPTKYPIEEWGNVNSDEQIFIKLLPKVTPENVNKTINTISDKQSKEQLKTWGNVKRWHVMQPLSNIHLDSSFGDRHRKADSKVLYGLIGVAIFLLLLACINYINLSTAQASQRSKEIGIRKTLGSGQGQLIIQFLGETFFVVLLALAVSYGLTQVGLLYFEEMLPKDFLQNRSERPLWVFLPILVVLVSFLAGLYPAWVVARFAPIKILRGSTVAAIPSGKATLRKGLIVFQFVVAQLFIIGAIIVGSQLRYVLNNDLGFQRDAILTIDIPWEVRENSATKDRHFLLKNELRQLSGVSQIALGNPLLSQNYSSNTQEFINEKGQKVERNVFRKYADTGIIPLYGLQLLAGRNLQPSDTVTEYVINEVARKTFGFKSPQDAIGKFLVESGSKRSVPIVGVVNDFHSASFTKKIEPIAFMTSKESLGTLNIKLASGHPEDWQPVLKNMEKVWKKFYPDEAFAYKFYDDTLKAIYESERHMASVINFATIVAILISCLGLFGLVTLTAFQRTKEIGIRKVLGATVFNITTLLSKDFLRLVGIAIMIASPIAYYFMDEWLQSFEYRIQITWWIFVLAGMAAVVVAFITVSFQAIKAALMNPVKSLKTE